MTPIQRKINDSLINAFFFYTVGHSNEMLIYTYKLLVLDTLDPPVNDVFLLQEGI